MQVSLIEADTRRLLEQWGRWVGSNQFASLMYPSIEPFYKMAPERINDDTRTPVPQLMDATAIIIDREIGRLIERDEEMGVTTALYYTTGADYSGVARIVSKRRDTNRKRVATLVQAGTAWIDAALSAKLE